MSRRCPECHNTNEDTRTFCAFCGATLDPHLRLIQDLEKQQAAPKKEPSSRKREISFYPSKTAPQETKKSAAPWIILGLAVLAVALWFFLNG